MTRQEMLLVYDKQCPFCDHYCRLVRLRDSVGSLTLVDAREDTEIRDEITAAGLDIDQGMVLKIGDRLYYGDDAIHVLALMSSRTDAFNRINYWIFRSSRRARWLYPVLRSCRNFLLKLLGKTKVNNLALKDNERF
ncbi:DCC1-like thiol-disulfide oxidoreductase family protein [Litchfieldella rifensis]|uniref:DCC1-like thiol-disulfide oxidoreductase family protein n=1 Tax=Litchfieldella rifensis TaxID=762643 RepID=A0ABV7LT34_9GAMM